jgi:hypothetical protein
MSNPLEAVIEAHGLEGRSQLDAVKVRLVRLAAAALGEASDTMMAHPLALQLRTCRAWSRSAWTRTPPWSSLPR